MRYSTSAKLQPPQFLRRNIDLFGRTAYLVGCMYHRDAHPYRDAYRDAHPYGMYGTNMTYDDDL